MSSKIKGGLQKYTIQEVQNATLGQAGCVFVDTADAVVAPTGAVFVAITFLTNVTLDASAGLIAEDSDRWANTEAAASAGGTGGKQLDAGNTFPKGTTIYGRWTEIDLNSVGTLIAYLG